VNERHLAITEMHYYKYQKKSIAQMGKVKLKLAGVRWLLAFTAMM